MLETERKADVARRLAAMCEMNEGIEVVTFSLHEEQLKFALVMFKLTQPYYWAKNGIEVINVMIEEKLFFCRVELDALPK